MYSIITTIGFIVAIALFVWSLYNGIRNLDAIEEKLRREVSNRASLDSHFKRLQGEHELTMRQCQEAVREVHDLKDRLAGACSDLREANQKLRERSALSSVKFTANIPNTGWTRTEFKLGTGPCGKEVSSIEFKEFPDHYVLIQRCTDGERKEFEYRKEEIAGRIERAYKK